MNLTEREKRLLTRIQKKKKQEEAITCVEMIVGNKKRTIKYCDKQDIISNKHTKRKTQKANKGNIKRDSPYIRGHGINYYDEKFIIKSLFNKEDKYSLHISGYDHGKRIIGSYIYIISKKIDSRTFIKIGYSTLSSNSSQGSRLRSFQTTLIPGLENIGFKVHFLFFYGGEAYGTGSSTISKLHEEYVHKVLKEHETYKDYIVHMPSEQASEWYLPSNGDYKSFFDFILQLLAVSRPLPIYAYEFKVNREKQDVRINKEVFFPDVAKEDMYKFRRDLKEESQRHRQQTTETTTGNVSYYRDKLLQIIDNKPPCGKDIEITEIFRQNNNDNIHMKYGEYYCLLKSKTSYSELSKMLDVIRNTNQENSYVSHIFDVLNLMKKLNTLELYNLETNFNYYDITPINKAKETMLSNIEGNDEKPHILIKDILWMKGRHFIDKNKNKYKVIDFKKQHGNSRKASQIICQHTSSPYNKVESNIYTTIKLLIDFFDGKTPYLDIKTNYKEEVKKSYDKVKYKKFSLIKTNKNHYKINNKPVDTEFIGLVYDIKSNPTNDNYYGKVYYVLFETDDWYEDTLCLESNSKILASSNGKNKNTKSFKMIKNFLENTSFSGQGATHCANKLKAELGLSLESINTSNQDNKKEQNITRKKTK
jgi:hypothetical protein